MCCSGAGGGARTGLTAFSAGRSQKVRGLDEQLLCTNPSYTSNTPSTVSHRAAFSPRGSPAPRHAVVTYLSTCRRSLHGKAAWKAVKLGRGGRREAGRALGSCGSGLLEAALPGALGRALPSGRLCGGRLVRCPAWSSPAAGWIFIFLVSRPSGLLWSGMPRLVTRG